MKINHNIGSVVARLNRLQAAVPVAAAKALQQAAWLVDARELAERTLLSLATPDQRQFVPMFVATVVAGVLEGGMFLRMRNPFPPAQTLPDIQAARAAVSNQDLGGNLFLKQVQDFESLLEEWVATEKDKDKRDAGKTDEEIASLLSWILLGSHEPGSRAAVAQHKLTPHIAQFLARRQSRLDAPTSNLWLRTVLMAWRELVALKFPERFRAELRSAREQLIPN